ncbi:MAG: glycosyltransferase family 4 protein, partial [Candidatus Sumerlaeia bacterium]|nr:glycosyltransferase family 4 protein [Candidatus Sumerlaeia bacterium]
MQTKIRVLYLTPSVKLLGARKSLLALVKGLGENFEPIVVCPRPGPLTDELARAGIKTEIIPLYPWRKGKYFLRRYLSVWRLRKLLKELAPRIIHCNEFYVMPYAVLASYNLNISLVTHIRLNITQKQIQHYYLSRAEKIIAVSRAMAEIFDHTPLHERVTVIYNAVDEDEFKTSANDENIRTELGIPPSEVVVGQIGSIETRKRQQIALLAARKVINEFPHITFVFVGDPRHGRLKYIEKLKMLAKNLQLEDKVHFLPFRLN